MGMDFVYLPRIRFVSDRQSTATNSKSPQGVVDTVITEVVVVVVVVSGFYCIIVGRECANKMSTQSGWEGLSRRKQERPQDEALAGS